MEDPSLSHQGSIPKVWSPSRKGESPQEWRPCGLVLGKRPGRSPSMEATRSPLNHGRGGKVCRSEFRPQARDGKEATGVGLKRGGEHYRGVLVGN